MSGIAGFSGAFDPALLDDMSSAIAARGPDDSGSLHLPAVGLGLAHRRLSIIDPSPSGHQPMWDATGTAAITCNGEIYDFRALRKELRADGYRFNGNSDTEVILGLYLRDGGKLLERLNGVFAFAIWDSRSKSLLIARDAVGAKPLYYAETPKGFVFASEIKALLREPSIDRVLDRDAVRHHLLYGWCPAPLTMLESVKKLEPGRALQVKAGRVTGRWRFADPPLRQEPVDWPKEDAIVQVRKYLTRAVDRQLVADVPIGAFLSGGLESSAVAALAQRRMGKQKLQCFTIATEDDAGRREGTGTDLLYSRMVAEHLNVDLHTVRVGPEMADALQKTVFHLEEPPADPAPLHGLFIARLARQHGIKVLLSGAGGDTVFDGTHRHHAGLLSPLCSRLSLPLQRAVRNASASLAPDGERRRQIAKAFRYADLEGNRRIASSFRRMAPELLSSLVRPSRSDDLGAMESDAVLAALARLPPDLSRRQRAQYLESRFVLADHDLNRVDKVPMAQGVAVRAPLIDADLMALLARLPLAYRQRGGIDHWLLRKAMEPYLPQQVLHQPKSGSGEVLSHWLQGGLRPLLEEVLSDASLQSRGLFDPEGVRELVRLDRDRRAGAARTIFSLICVELWCRLFLDKPTPALG